MRKVYVFYLFYINIPHNIFNIKGPCIIKIIKAYLLFQMEFLRASAVSLSPTARE